MAIAGLARKTVLAAALLAGAALGGCDENTYRGNDRSAEDVPKEPAANVSDAATAVREADPVHSYPLPMGRDEFTKIVDSDEACSFRMTSSDFPVLVFTKGNGGEDSGRAVMKLNGKLVELMPAGSSSNEIVVEAEGIRASVVPEVGDEAPREAALRFKLDGAEERGYWGYYDCGRDSSAARHRTG